MFDWVPNKSLINFEVIHPLEVSSFPEKNTCSKSTTETLQKGVKIVQN